MLVREEEEEEEEDSKALVREGNEKGSDIKNTFIAIGFESPFESPF